MKFSTAKQHRDFFNKNGWIIFDEMLSDDQLDLTNQAIDRVLSERMPQQSKDKMKSDELFMRGRDLWRSDPYLKKIITNTRFADIATELIEKKPLRLAFDQYIPERSENLYFTEKQSAIDPYFKDQCSLQESSSINGISCGLMICLRNGHSNPAENEGNIDPYPNQKGQFLYFKPDKSIHWDAIFRHEFQSYYLIAYCNANSHYQHEPKDPHTHYLKKLGYVFNDPLKSNLHPLIHK